VIEISIVINAHREGDLLAPSLESALAAADLAAEHGIATETIVVLDRPDDTTREIVERHQRRPALRPDVIDIGDLGGARNHGVTLARGRYVAFLDGDDLWGDAWLVHACRAAREATRPTIWHPEANLIFGDENPHVFLHRDMEDLGFEQDWLRVANYWTALSFAELTIYSAFPYPSNRLAEGFGYEDWSWNISTIAAGITHRTVEGTIHCVRRKPGGSLLASTVQSGALPDWSPLFGGGDRSPKADPQTPKRAGT
jgi:glycosyltransferase involved in cell wall biosynthesis